MAEVLGIVGVGRMGLPIAARLVDARYRVVAFDSDSEHLVRASDAGCRTVTGIAEMASGTDVLMTVLPGPSECRDAMIGAGGALAAMRPGSCWLDLTSNDPRIAVEIAAHAEHVGVAAVGAPMRGGPPDAAAGTLGFYVGGADRHLRRVQPVLDALGGSGAGKHVGSGIGDGYLAKLLANSLWFGQVVAVTECLLLGQKLGLAPDALAAVLAESPAGSVFIDSHLPALLGGDYLESFGIDRVVEELDTVVSLATGAETPSDMLTLIADIHRRSLDRFGPVAGELLAAKLLEERADTTLRHRQTNIEPTGDRS